MEATNGRRTHFNILATTTPKLLVGAGGRQAVTFVNGAAVSVYLGFSGTLTNTGVLLASNGTFHDLFSSDEWWVQSASSSGTVSGFIVT